MDHPSRGRSGTYHVCSKLSSFFRSGLMKEYAEVEMEVLQFCFSTLTKNNLSKWEWFWEPFHGSIKNALTNIQEFMSEFQTTTFGPLSKERFCLNSGFFFCSLSFHYSLDQFLCLMNRGQEVMGQRMMAKKSRVPFHDKNS